MTDWPILSIMIFLPLTGVMFISSIYGDKKTVARNAKNVALLTTATIFFLSLNLLSYFDAKNGGFQIQEQYEWIKGAGISLHLGLDGISLFFVILSAFLSLICVIMSWKQEHRVKEYMICFLLMETMMIGMFCALDLVLFYIFFEGVLIPMFIIIGIWGGDNKIYAAFKFFLYTLLGSLLMLIAVLYIYNQTGTMDIPELLKADFAKDAQKWLWLAMFASFAIKIPMFPFHTWLPDAHVEAPTAGSVLLAGVLLKMGGYGFVRFSLPMFPEATLFFAPYMIALGTIAIIYTSLVALVQEDMKKLIAYSSVAHMGFAVVGIFSLNVEALTGAVFIMLSHGIIASGLFLLVGVLYSRHHSRLIKDYGGLVKKMPNYSIAFMILMLGAIGLPATSGFVGEFLVLLGLFGKYPIYTAFAGLGIVLGAAYMLYLYKRVVFGEMEKEELKSIKDLTPVEMLVFSSMVIIVLGMGIAPNMILRFVKPSVQLILTRYGF
jgi:NADH-quinone oxidoreductase subunit M